MEDKMKSMPFLAPLGFSLLLVLFLFMASCGIRAIEDYSFLNQLEEEVELFLYISHKDYSQKIGPYHMIPAGSSVKLLTKETKDRGGFGGDYFQKFVDSAMVKIHGQEKYIAVWRQGVEPELAEGYETLKDFHTDWGWYRQHAGNHAEYAYRLKPGWPWWQQE
jgi:hypothetical protein